MNVYDTVNKLAQELKESKEYNEYKELKKQIKENNELSEKIKQFEELRYNIQILTIQGKTPEKEKEEKLQNIYAELLKVENVKKYFDAEFKFNVLLADVNKIIGDAVKDVLN